MKKYLNTIAAIAVAISIMSCAKAYDLTAIPSAPPDTLPAGSNAADCDFYVLNIPIEATGSAGINFASDTSYGKIKMSGIGYTDASNVAALNVTITVDRVKKEATAVIKVVYANETDIIRTVTLIGGKVQGTATTMAFTVKDEYTSGVLVNINVQGAVAMVSMREQNPLYNANGAFLDNVGFQVNPKTE